MKLIVADSGPLIIFAKTIGLEVLRAVAQEMVIPATVAKEATSDADKAGATAIREAIDGGILKQVADPDVSGLAALRPIVDPGETAAIVLAKSYGCRVLLDDRRARSVARRLGVKVIGSAGMLLLAKERGAIEKVYPVLESWKNVDYFLSDRLILEVVKRAGELEDRPKP